MSFSEQFAIIAGRGAFFAMIKRLWMSSTERKRFLPWLELYRSVKRASR